jgi:hypothetical protein
VASKGAATARLHGSEHCELGEVSFVEVPIDGSSSLGTAVALAVVELKRIDAVSTSYAFESDAAVHRLGRVIAHNLHCNLSEGNRLSKRCWPFE